MVAFFQRHGRRSSLTLEAKFWVSLVAGASAPGPLSNMPMTWLTRYRLNYVIGIRFLCTKDVLITSIYCIGWVGSCFCTAVSRAHIFRPRRIHATDTSQQLRRLQIGWLYRLPTNLEHFIEPSHASRWSLATLDISKGPYTCMYVSACRVFPCLLVSSSRYHFL